MHTRVAVVYNEPYASGYDAAGEREAVVGVLRSVNAVHSALADLGYQVSRVPLLPPLELAMETLSSLEVDLVFNLFEGFYGYPEAEALVPDVLSKLEIPCTGCPSAALRLGMDKAKAKVILRAAAIPTPDFQLLNPDTVCMFRLRYPCIVKPRSEDASHGLSPQSLVSDFAALEKQVNAVHSTYGGGALVEEFIDGQEFNATIMGSSRCIVLPVSEIVYSLPVGMPRILTFAAKWEPDSPYFRGTRAICPARVSPEQHQSIASTAMAVFRLAGCRGYARVDMRAGNEGGIQVIEINPNPDISPGSGVVLQAEAAGMSYRELVGRIVEMALETRQG